MTQLQQQAEQTATPNRRTQHMRIVEWLDRFGFITPLACMRSVPMITTKLSTRIGELERKAGVTLKREVQQPSKFVRYSATREQIEILKQHVNATR